MNKKVFLVPVSVAFLLAFGTISAQNSTRLIQDYYQKKGEFTQKNNGIKKVDVRILNEDVSKSLGVTIVNVQQTYDGRRVYNALGKVIIKDEKIISEKNEFSRNIVTAVQKKTQEKFSEDFLKQKLELKAIRKINYLPDVYFEKNGIYILSKEIFVSDKNSSAVWHVIAAADTGEILSKDNATLSCNFDHPDDEKLSTEELKSHSEITERSERETNTNIKAHLLLPDNASYNVFALPVEAPTFGSRSLVTNPWDLTASPEGWHSDGTNHYTNTRGNNVYAYSDQDKRDTPGYSPDGGNSRNFDFPFADGSNDSPFTYRDAGITNLFYMNNKMHDIFYRFGFTESARNFQTNNFDRGGIGGDAVNAEAFDGSGLGNANFDPGYEYIENGVPNVEAPRMQMYLFPRKATATDPNPTSKYHYNAPPDMVSRPEVRTYSAYDISIFNSSTGDLAIPSSDNSCTAMAAGSLTGRIALIKDGGCQYGLKILNAQNAGAIGAIIYSPTYTNPYFIDWGQLDNYINQINIRFLDMGKTEGEFLVGQINSGTVINTTLGLDNTTGFKHSSLDNGIVAHEYGHGISTRLTGDGYDCLRSDVSNEQMGEGWSDYFALMLTARPGDNAALARGMGTYVLIQSTNGTGIRLARYSPDFSVNNYTYGRTNSSSVPIPHGMGFVWATMLWDLTWQYIERYGYNSDVLASTTSGNARALQIVMDALKLQDCNPTFIDGRDAIIRADSLGNAGADRCMIWNAFARRGLGLNASAGNKAVRDDQVEDFTVPADCNTTLATHETNTANTKYIVFPNPTYDEFFVGNIDKSSQEVKIKMFDMSGKLVFSDTRESTSRKAISTKNLQKGVYMVNIQQGDKMQTEKLIVR